MSRRDRIRDPHLESALFRRRALVAGLFMLALLGTLVARLYHLQQVEFDHYSTLSKNNRVRLQAVAPTRGQIFDRNGVLLADNLPTYQLEIIPEEVEDMPATLAGLAEHIEISEGELTRFQRAVKRARPFEGIPLRFRLSDEEVAKLAVVRHQFPGVDVAARLARHYPQGPLGVHTIGYVGRINERELQRVDPVNYRATDHIGKIGVERYYEDILHGQVGYQRVEVNVAGRVLRVLEDTPPVAGNNLYLTLDSRLQRIAELALGDYSGAVVALDPRNGEVLAMASRPTYDPNLFVNGIGRADYAALRDNPERPLFNRTLTGQYPPGSTIKPMVGLAGLATGVQSTSKRNFCVGYYQLPNDEHRYRDWKRGGHGLVDLSEAINQSCDVLFYDLALRMGIDRLSPVLGQFGFGRVTGIDTVGEAPGILPSREWKREARGRGWYPGETLITGIGQGYFTTTPLQLAHATGALAMSGERPRPHLLRAVAETTQPPTDADPFEPLPPVPVADANQWRYVQHAMERVASDARGTARRAFAEAGYLAAGKTGTAQVFTVAQDEEYDAEELSRKLLDHALFVGYAPADDPQIAVAVIVEHGGSGGRAAAPIARRVMDAWLVELPQLAPTATVDVLDATPLELPASSDQE
jgi:penicillin-binding protein 2